MYHHTWIEGYFKNYYYYTNIIIGNFSILCLWREILAHMWNRNSTEQEKNTEVQKTVVKIIGIEDIGSNL